MLAGLTDRLIKHQLILPVEQRSPLAFLLAGDVLGDREQPIGFFVTRIAIMRGGIGVAHNFHGQIHGIGHQSRRIQVLAIRQLAILLQQRDEAVLQTACATQHQMDRDVDAGVHLSNLFLLSDDPRQRALTLAVKQTFQPTAHGLTQAALNLIMGQEQCRPRISQHLGIEGLGQVDRVPYAETQDKTAALLAEAPIQQTPFL